MKKAQTETENARDFLWRGLIAIGVIWVIVMVPTIYVGETTLWANEATKLASGYTKDAEPSIEILAGDKWATGGVSRK
jgi:hypothetical protein